MGIAEAITTSVFYICATILGVVLVPIALIFLVLAIMGVILLILFVGEAISDWWRMSKLRKAKGAPIDS